MSPVCFPTTSIPLMQWKHLSAFLAVCSKVPQSNGRALFGWDWCYFLILSVKTSFLFLIEHQSTYQRLIWSVWAIWIFPKRSYDFPRKRESTMKITASWCCLISLSCVLKLSRLRLFPQFLWYNKFPVIMDQVSGFSLVDINPNTTLKYKLFLNFNWI